MKTIIEILNNKLPSFLDKTTDEFKAIIGDINFTPNSTINESSDYQCGAIANELEYLRGYIKYVINSDNIDTLESDFLEKVSYLFLTYKHIYDETDESLRKRVKAYLQRNNNPRWSTKWSVRDVFSYFFNTEDIYVLENPVLDSDNLIQNSDFENTTGNEFDNWTRNESGSSAVSIDDTNPFSNSKCVKFVVDSSNSACSIEQGSISVSSNDYKVSLFAKATTSLSDGLILYITRSSDSYYFNFATKSWQSGSTGKTFDLTDSYSYLEAIFNVNSSDTIKVKIESKIASTTFYVDRVRLGAYKTYPTLKVLISTQGDVGLFASLSDGGNDQLIDRADCESSTPPAVTPETSVTTYNSTFAIDSAQSHGGSNSYKLTKTASSGSAGYVALNDNENTNDMHGLIAGKTYTFSIWAYVPTTGGVNDPTDSNIRLRYYSDSSWHETFVDFQNIKDSWQFVRTVVTLPSNTTGITLRIGLGSTNNNGEYFYVDDIRLAEGDVPTYSNSSYLDNDFVTGAGGGFTPKVYTDLLDRIKEAGTYSEIEFITSLVV